MRPYTTSTYGFQIKTLPGREWWRHFPHGRQPEHQRMYALSNANGQSLLNRLQSALDYLNSGQTDKACDKLADFIQKTQNFISTGSLTSAQGQPLIDSAQHLRNTLGCNGTSGSCT